ncbi:hypothetical protein NKR23_g736 [Pleurostoma richardsiae]|uniref:Ribosomal protein L9 domain-containing protein n=1 Tax=Pleurostoma richardsiae TaxID=41990 RepID=A0AA38W0K9_9PEZI|nr:hypothetical protein NKR23_g736 [Pleurostoma richardsiae]
MATPLVAQMPTCMTCLRRLARTALSPISLTQVRAKSKGRPVDQGVLVRLLEDIPKFGRKNSIFRTERGRMRNSWFPQKQAEYMTAARFAELGLTKDAIGARDPLFGTFVSAEDALEATVLKAPEPAKKKPTVEPERAHALLATLLPETLTFTRKLIHAPAAVPSSTPRSPLLAAQATVSDAAQSSPSSPAEEAAAATPAALDPAASLAIYGSVSANDVAALIRDRLLRSGDAEAARITLDGAHVRFVGLEDAGADRVKALGRWEVEILAGGVGSMEPVRKVVEVVAEKESAPEAAQ